MQVGKAIAQAAQQAWKPVAKGLAGGDAAAVRLAGDEFKRVQAQNPVLGHRNNAWHTRIEASELQPGFNGMVASMPNVNLKGANLAEASFYGADMRNAHLDLTHAPKSIWVQSDLTGASFVGSRSPRSQFMESQLYGTIFDGAFLGRSDFTNARGMDSSFVNVDLSFATLQSMSVPNAKLAGATLRGANLRDVDLPAADLTGADLRGADLRGANLLGATLKDVLTDHKTRWDGAQLDQPIPLPR